jgi:hypothetical protein
MRKPTIISGVIVNNQYDKIFARTLNSSASELITIFSSVPSS